MFHRIHKRKEGTSEVFGRIPRSHFPVTGRCKILSLLRVIPKRINRAHKRFRVARLNYHKVFSRDKIIPYPRAACGDDRFPRRKRIENYRLAGTIGPIRYVRVFRRDHDEARAA